MRTAYCLFLFFIVLSVSCSNAPRKTITMDKMAVVMADLDLANKMVREFPLVQRDSMTQLLEEGLLKVHDITEEELEVNLYLYQSDYKEYDKLLLKIIENHGAKSESKKG